jgi:hypothetical protein
MKTRSWWLVISVALIARTAVAQNAAATTSVVTRTEVLRGRVTNDSGAAIVGATVIATMAPDRTVGRDSTGGDGRYSLRFERGTGDYLVYASAPGFRPFRRRVLLPTAEFTVDIRLVREPTAQQLAAVRVNAPRPRPAPDLAGQASLATNEASSSDAVTGALTPDQVGDLMAIAASMPGVSVGPNGTLTVNGVNGQTQTTLNGMAFAGGDLPRDVRARVRVTTSSWDPSVGGFGAARVNLEIANGSNGPGYYTNSHLTLDAPVLQATDPIARRLGQGATNVRFSIGGAGELVPNKTSYNYGIQLNRLASTAPAFDNVGADVLRSLGVSADSAQRLATLLTARGIPLRGGAPTDRLAQSVSALGWVGYIPRATGPRAPPPSTIATLTGAARLSRDDSPGRGPAATLASGTHGESFSGQVIGSYIRYPSDALLVESSLSLGLVTTSADRALALPAGAVRIASSLGGASPVVRSLAFGGASTGARSNTLVIGEVTNTVQRLVGKAHRVKLFDQLRYEGGSSSAASNDYGQFTFNSLADFASGAPSSYSRTLARPSVRTGVVNAALGVGDVWTVKPTFTLEYSTRLEANSYLEGPSRNAALGSALGVRNDARPNEVAVAPRAGFAWVYGSAQPAYLNSGLGTIVAPPRGVLSGGIGLFRNAAPLSLLAGATANTGLADGVRQIACVGSATPIPDWSAYASDPSRIPSSCVGGASGALADEAPAVNLVNSDFTMARSWRATLRWQSAYRKLRWSLEGNAALNTDQASTLDVNFAGLSRFALSDEGGRSVFVTPGAIVPATGLLSSKESRRSSAFGVVREARSDMSSFSRSLTLRVVPEILPSKVLLSVAYTLGDVRTDARGYDGTTFGDPTLIERVRSSFDIRHQVMVQGSYSISPSLWLSGMARFSSGAPYTPVIASDVNGDGLANDRAFVFDPSSAADPAVASGMRALLDRTSSQARACLQRQLARPASANSCEGPWTANLNVALGTRIFRVLDGRAFSVRFVVSNLLGGLDQALHGSDRLHGWGASAAPDPVLLTVRGFDAAAKRFQYDVNPRFGSTRPSETVVRAPFRVTLDFSLEVGVPSDRQAIQRRLDRGRGGRSGAKANADSLVQFFSGQVPDLYEVMLSVRDSLLLTTAQVTTLQQAALRYNEKTKALWAELGRWAADVPDDYDAREVARRSTRAVEEAWVLLKSERPLVLGVLTPLQRSLLTGFFNDLLYSEKSVPIRWAIR